MSLAKSVEGSLAELDALSRDELAVRWTVAFGCPAPHRSGATLLRLAVAWHCQLKSSPDAGARLSRDLQRTSPPVDVLSPGTRLLREWQGSTHSVLVSVQGFEYEGRCYRSLSAIAQHITGTAWSGPLFFGLRK